jgi:hypothetical protein
MDSLCVHALNSIKSANKMDDAELLLFSTLPAFTAGYITPIYLNALFPFTSPGQIQQQLAHLVELKLLLPASEDHYFLTEKGDQLATWISKEVNNALSGVMPISPTSMMDMASQLKAIDDACFSALEPPRKLHLSVQRKLTPAGTIPIMVRIQQILKELAAYRIDAHHSAWSAYIFDAHAWEILTLLWQGKKLNVDAMHQTLASRGFTLEETFGSISELSRRGWVINSNDDLSITPFGAEIRRIAENTTDRYYFAPWQPFSEAGLTELRDLVEEFRRGIPMIELI